MNPGYLGRSELPEGLKALFRPITVVVPDLELICENMLMAEGFVEAKELARKFTRLYALCKDLLSRAPHYDWGLRAIKSVLVVAGTFKRQWPELSEQAILMKALRDSNLAKIVADDAKIFQGTTTLHHLKNLCIQLFSAWVVEGYNINPSIHTRYRQKAGCAFRTSKRPIPWC